MSWYTLRHCRWCSGAYKPQTTTDRDGFCSSKCRQALYRARKKYVTQSAALQTNKRNAKKKRTKRR